MRISGHLQGNWWLEKLNGSSHIPQSFQDPENTGNKELLTSQVSLFEKLRTCWWEIQDRLQIFFTIII